MLSFGMRGRIRCYGFRELCRKFATSRANYKLSGVSSARKLIDESQAYKPLQITTSDDGAIDLTQQIIKKNRFDRLNGKVSEFSSTRQLIKENQVYKPQIIKEVDTPIDMTRQIIEKSRKVDISFYDPANSSLDIHRPNAEILRHIMNGAKDRMSKRFEKPSNQWKLSNEVTPDKWEQLEKDYTSSIERSTISLIKANQDINVGDLVLIGEGTTDIFMIIALPKELGNFLYTFVNHEGEIIHAPKTSILVRFPGIIPAKLRDITDSLLVLEEKYLDIAPIGVPDGQFSKSKRALPVELQPEDDSKTEEKVAEGEDINSVESGDDFIVSQASSQLLINTDVNTYVIPTAARALFSKSLSRLSIKIFDELPIIQQKLSILQKLLQIDENNDIVESSRTFSMFQILKLLDFIDEKNVDFDKLTKDYLNLFSIDSATSSLGKLIPNNELWGTFAEDEYPISQFCALVLSINMNGKSWNLVQKNSSKVPITVELLPISSNYEKTLKFLKQHRGSAIFTEYVSEYVRLKQTAPPPHYDEIIQLLKDYICENFTHEPVIETAVVNIIRSTDKILTQQLGMKPLVEYAFEYSKYRAFELLQVLDGFKAESHGWENPSNWSKTLKLPGNKLLVMSDLSEDYYKMVDSAFTSDSTFTSETSTSASNNSKLGLLSGQGFLSDTTSKLGLLSDSDILSDRSKQRPLSDSDFLSGRELLSGDFHSEDPYKAIRQPFGDIPVYCIDSAAAHEIDDGISIHREGQQYVFTVHVANPTSYLKPNSIINRIALNRGVTNYFPEGPSMMFPKVVSKIAGLESTAAGEQKRTFAVQFTVNQSILDEFIESGKLPDVDEFESQLEQSVDIKLCLVSNLPQGFTYEQVNKVLETKQETSRTNRECVQKLQLKNNEDLKKLFNMAKIIQTVRRIKGSGIDLSASSSKSVVSVDYKEPQTNNRFSKADNEMELVVHNGQSLVVRPVIRIANNSQQDATSKSQLLVSQFMIMANYLCTKYAHKHNIGIIYRNQEMNLHSNVESQISRIMQQSFDKNQNKQLSLEEYTNIISVLTSATNQAVKKKHQSIGLDGYATITSPLRRYMDMVNHSKFEQHLLKTKSAFATTDSQSHAISSISDSQLEFIGNHLQNRELISRKFSKFSNKFWQSIFLKQYFELEPTLKPHERIRFKVLPRTNPKFGDVRATLVNFEQLNVKLETSAKLTEQFDHGNFRVGLVLQAEMELVKLDIIEDEVVLRLKMQ